MITWELFKSTCAMRKAQKLEAMAGTEKSKSRKESRLAKETHLGDLVISFSKADYNDMLPHQDDPMVISIVATEYKVERASYNIILGRPTLNQLRAIVSTPHLCMKYLVVDRIGVVWLDQLITRWHYKASLTTKSKRDFSTNKGVGH
ncbi:hypothetical protein CR513_43427, partial [Mucuna pruriens]